MDTFIPAFFRRQRNQRRLTLEMLSAKVGMSAQHLSEIESGKRDARLSSIERMADALGMTVLIVPQSMAPDLRRYIANNGRVYTSPYAASHTDPVAAFETTPETTPENTTQTTELPHAPQNTANTPDSKNT